LRRLLINLSLSAKKAILTCFSKPCQALGFLVCLSAPPSRKAR
jgi:hypothetical protein